MSHENFLYHVIKRFFGLYAMALFPRVYGATFAERNRENVVSDFII
jgi:hypothetical protein